MLFVLTKQLFLFCKLTNFDLIACEFFVKSF
nr:MAG TPA: hypothetical protein [Caudoviricetes sp.]